MNKFSLLSLAAIAALASELKPQHLKQMGKM